MPHVKATMLFSLTTAPDNGLDNARTGGWSESWYFSGTIAETVTAFTSGAGALCPLRAALLPATASIMGQRYQTVDPLPVGAAISRARDFPGRPVLVTDVPQMALLISCVGVAVPNVKHFVMRGVPDENVVGGEFKPVVSYANALELFLAKLGTFKFKGMDSTVPKIAVSEVNTAAGTCTTKVPHNFVVGDRVRFTGLQNSQTVKSFSEERTVISIPTVNTFVFASQLIGFTYTIGFVRKKTTIYIPVDPANSEVQRATVRKVGRPFDQYVGRR